MNTDDTDSQETGQDGASTAGDGEATVTVAEAAQALGLTVDAVRSRLHRGTLQGMKVQGTWRVMLPTEDIPNRLESEPTVDRQVTTVGKQSETVEATATDRAATVDLTPLAELIERQGRELAETREAAAIWQVRALQAEERLQQLAATVEATESPESAPSGDQDQSHRPADTSASGGAWTRLRRWLTGG